MTDFLSNNHPFAAAAMKESQGSQTQTSAATAPDEFEHLHASRAMKESLRQLREELRCTLCGEVYRVPATLSCAHSFCKECIDDYVCNNWNCPYPGCNQLCAIQAQGSYRKVNPALSSLVTSLQTTMETLKCAPPDWWKEGGDIPAPFEEEQESQEEEYSNEGDYDDDDANDDDDESIDLQQTR